jgi:hypothetical protein
METVFEKCYVENIFQFRNYVLRSNTTYKKEIKLKEYEGWSIFK